MCRWKEKREERREKHEPEADFRCETQIKKRNKNNTNRQTHPQGASRAVTEWNFSLSLFHMEEGKKWRKQGKVLADEGKKNKRRRRERKNKKRKREEGKQMDGRDARCKEKKVRKIFNYLQLQLHHQLCQVVHRFGRDFSKILDE